MDWREKEMDVVPWLTEKDSGGQMLLLLLAVSLFSIAGMLLLCAQIFCLSRDLFRAEMGETFAGCYRGGKYEKMHGCGQSASAH